VSRTPFVLVTAPLDTGQEEDHATDGQTTADEVDLTNDLLLRQAPRVWSRWGKVEDERADEADTRPEATEESAVSPSGIVGDQLTPEDGWAEGNDGEYEDCNIFPALSGRGKFGRDGQRGSVRTGLSLEGTNSLMKMFIWCAVPQIIMAMMSKPEPPRATYRLPMRSEMEPTKGQMAARANR